MRIIKLDALGYRFTVGKANFNLNGVKVTSIIKNEETQKGYIVFFEDRTEADIITDNAVVLWGK